MTAPKQSGQTNQQTTAWNYFTILRNFLPNHRFNHYKVITMSLKRLLLPGIVLLGAAWLTACGGSEEDHQAAQKTAAADSAQKADSAIKAEAAKAQETFPLINYRTVHIGTRALLDSIRTAFARKKNNDTANRVITTLNRKEFGYFRVGDSVLLPDKVVGDLRAYSVFPQRYPAADTIPKLIMISNAYQCYACYEKGKLVRFAATNTGRESKPTFPGRYSLIWKERLRRSSLDSNWKLPFNWNFHQYAGSALHQFTLPGRPVSHSCCRQFMTDAKWLFDWGEGGVRDGGGKFIPFSGTPVIILGMFDFARPKFGPWLELKSNRDRILELPKNPMGVEEALIPMSQVPAGARGSVPDRNRYKYAEDTLRARGIIRPESRLSASINYNALRKAKWDRIAKMKKAKAKAQAKQPDATPAAPPPPPSSPQ